MGELIELAESLRWALEELGRERIRNRTFGLPPGGYGTAWNRLYRTEDSIREFEREMAREG